MKFYRKLLSLLLAAALVFGLLPVSALSVRAEDRRTETVSYVDAQGTLQTVQATVLTGYEPRTFNYADTEYVFLGQTETETWYVVTQDLAYARYNDYKVKFCLRSTVHLILCDGVTLRVDGFIPDPDADYCGLFLFGQTAQTGRLETLELSGINSLYLHGGELETDCIDAMHLGLRCCAVNAAQSIRAGSDANLTGNVVTPSMIAKSLYILDGSLRTDAITISDNGYMRGGSVTVDGDVSANGRFEITGGTICVNGDFSVGNSLSLGWTSPQDRYSFHSVQCGTAYVPDGQELVDGEYIYSGTLNSEDFAHMAGKTLMPPTSTTPRR